MSSPLPATEKLIYMIQTKLQLEIPESLRHDIETTLWNYGQEVSKVYKQERDDWKERFLEWR
jgi:hypothetical protein